MKYSHIVNYVASAVWAIDPDKMSELLSVLAFRAAGHTFTAQEIQARIGGGEQGSPAPTKQGAIAVIPMRGVIANRMGSMDDTSGGTSCERIGAMIDLVAPDPNIVHIVYDFDTPGGTVPGVQELGDKMFALRGVKKQTAQVNGMAASAGYWLASQCDEIVCAPSSSAGSIGVYTVVHDLTAALEKEGIKVEVLRAGKYKIESNPFEPLSKEGRAFIHARIDEAYAQFTKDVARGRGVTAADVRGGYGQGRMLTAKDAKAAGLIDRIGTMDDTLSRLATHQGRTRVGMKAEGAFDDLNALVVALDEDAAELAEKLTTGLPAAEDKDRARRFRVL